MPPIVITYAQLSSLIFSGHLSLTSLISALNTVNQHMGDGVYVDMGFLNFSKGFDIVNHRFLCVRLVALEVPPLVVS